MQATKAFITKPHSQITYKPYIYCSIAFLILCDYFNPSNPPVPPLILFVSIFFAIYRLEESKPVIKQIPKANSGNLEIGEIVNCIIDENRFIIYQSNHRMFEFYWTDFSSYFIDNKILYLIKTNTAETVKLDESKTGVKYFQEIFLEMMERV